MRGGELNILDQEMSGSETSVGTRTGALIRRVVVGMVPGRRDSGRRENIPVATTLPLYGRAKRGDTFPGCDVPIVGVLYLKTGIS